MQKASKSSADLVADTALAEKNQAPMDGAKANGKKNKRSEAKSNRSSDSLAANATEISIAGEASAEKSNSAVKDFDAPSPSASKKTPLDSDSKGGLRQHDTPHPLGGLKDPAQPEATEEKKESKANDTEPSKETRGSEHNSSVQGSRKRHLTEITGGLPAETASKGLKRLKLSEDPLASKKSISKESKPEVEVADAE